MLVEIKKPDSNGNGKVGTDRGIVIKYQEIKPGFFLLAAEKFQKGKEFFPDEQKILCLISHIARGKIVFWRKDEIFLDPIDFLNGHRLHREKAAEVAAVVGISDQDEYYWYQVSMMSPLDVYRSFCG